MVRPDEFAVVGTQHHYRGWVIDVRTDDVRMPDGEVARRDVISHPGAVAVVALDSQERVVMVRQYRHPVRDVLLELPAGLRDKRDEPPLIAAQRELFEEAAVRADEWHVLIDMFTSPGMTDEVIRIYLATGLTEVPADERFAAEHEELSMTVERHSLDELLTMIEKARLTNAPAVCGVLAARAARDRGWAGLRPADAPWLADIEPGRR